MKNITHKNLTRAAQMIIEKGYDRCEAVNMAWKAFRTARENNFYYTVEYYIDQIPNNTKLMDTNKNL